MGASDEDLQRALVRAYRYLNSRDRTEAEVRRHLERGDLDVAVVDRAICALIDQGYVDDQRFARLYVQDKRQLEQWGSERIRRGLSARGIDRDVIEETLAAEPRAEAQPTTAGSGADCQHDGEHGRALALLRRRFPVPPQDRRQRERALGVLQRKGYETKLALDALASYARDPQRPQP